MNLTGRSFGYARSNALIGDEMSFGFSALGTPEEVRRQISSSNVYEHELGDKVKAFLAEVMPTETFTSGPNEYRYMVKASGHSGPGTFSLNIQVEPFWVATPPSEETNDGN